MTNDNEEPSAASAGSLYEDVVNKEIIEQMKAVAKLMDMTDRFKPSCVVAVVGPEATAARVAFHKLWKTLVDGERNG